MKNDVTDCADDASLMPHHDTIHLLPINLFPYGMFQTGVLWTFHNFPSLLIFPSQLVPSAEKVTFSVLVVSLFVSRIIEKLTENLVEV